MAASRTGIGSLPILFRFSLPILAASRTGIGSLPIFENLRNAPEPVMERRILVGAAEPVQYWTCRLQQYRFWHITAIGQKITSNGSLPLWVVTYTIIMRKKLVTNILLIYWRVAGQACTCDMVLGGGRPGASPDIPRSAGVPQVISVAARSSQAVSDCAHESNEGSRHDLDEN